MIRYIAALFLMSASISTVASEVVLAKATPSIGATKGKIRVEWGETKENNDVRDGELRVLHAVDSTVIQRIKLTVSVPRDQLALQFLDLNDDGFQDLLFQNSRTGMAGAAYGADVFLWIPALERFVQSRTLSQMGEISKSKKKGCVEISTKCSALSWNTRTLCFRQESGRWREVANDHCPAPGP
jgi:hypothetical protein